jgi:uncharacterized membrane protein
MEKEKLETILRTEDEQLKKLYKIVVKAIDEEKILSQKLKECEDVNPPFSSKIADKVASFGGSWKFIIAFVAIMAIWMFANLYILNKPFDAYPFILLNLVLSTIAALQAPIIIMSQNRKEEKDRQRSMNDYLINLKAEIEIRNMHEKLDLLITEQMRTLFEIQKAQMDMMDDIKTNINNAPCRKMKIN